VNNHIENELSKHCNEGEIINIYLNYPKIVGIETNLNIINENDKYVGRILILLNAPGKLYLDMIVEFNRNKIKWHNVKEVDGKKLVLVDPYWVKSYAPSPKIKVQVKVFNQKSEQFVVEVMNLNFHQFQRRKLNEFLRQWQYILVAAYDNFYYLLKNNEYYFAINSTVKHYGLTQDSLKKVISIINNEKKKIKKEWNEYLNRHIQENESAKLIEELYGKRFKEEKTSNVVSFKK